MNSLDARFERLERRMTILEGEVAKLTGRPANGTSGAEAHPTATVAENARRLAFDRWRLGVVPGADVDERGARIDLEPSPSAGSFRERQEYADELARRTEQTGSSSPPPLPISSIEAEAPVTRSITALDEAPPTAPFWPSPLAAESDPPELMSKEAAVGLEVQIGTRWVAWIGALLVVMAVAFGLKFAYDSGYLRLSPPQKCWLAAGFGAALLGCGEFCLRRFGRFAAVSLFAAGLGVLYLTTFAAHHYFSLLSEQAAFLLLSLVALLGFGLTLRARMLTIGLISLVGGYAAPVLLNSASTNPMALPSYATVLLSIALCLSWRMPAPFRPLRYWVLGLHGLLCTLWLMTLKTPAWPIGAGFLTLWWTMITVESLVAARKNESPDGNAAASFLATAWLASAGCWLLAAHASREWLGAYAFALAGAAAAFAALSGAGWTALRDRPMHALSKLAVSLWVQCGALLATSIALQFDGDGLEGTGRTIGWLTLALACFELSRAIRSRGVQVFGCFIGALALLQLLTFDLAHAAVREPRWTLALGTWGGLLMSVWSLVALYAVAVLAWTAARLRVADSQARGILASLLATAAWMGWLAVTMASATGITITLLWIAPIPLLLALDRVRPDLRVLSVTPLLLAAGAVRWLAIDAIAASQAGTSAALWPLVNPQLFTAALIIGGLWLVGRAMSRQPQGDASALSREWATVVPIGTWFFGLIALSFEISRVLMRSDVSAVPAAAMWPMIQWHFLWIVTLWAAGAFGMLLEGRRSGSPALIASGWGVLLVAAVSWLTLGTSMPRVVNDVVACTPVFNAQFAAGFAIAVLMLAAARMAQRADGSRHLNRSTAELSIAFALTALIGLWLGTLELDRAVAYAGSAGVVRQTAFSVYWGLYAIALIAVGFARSVTWFRRAGLALLGITLLKVVLVDMADAGTLYRVLSFLALGLVLIVTSIIYARLSQRLLAPAARSAASPAV